MRGLRGCRALLLVAWILVLPASAEPLVINGEFSSGLLDWTWAGDVQASGESALLGDLNAANRLFQILPLTPDLYLFEFDFKGDLSMALESGVFRDTFFSSLYFVNNPNDFDLSQNLFDDVLALFDADSTGLFVFNGEVSDSIKGADWQHFSLQFVNTWNYAIPVYELHDLNLVSGDSGFWIDNVRMQVIPEPGTVGLVLAGLALCCLWTLRRRFPVLIIMSGLTLGAALAEGQIVNLSQQFAVSTANERSTLDRQTGRIVSTVDVSLLNLGGRTVQAPLHAFISLSTNAVEVSGALGSPGSYYVDLSGNLPAGECPPGGRVDFNLTFTAERGVQYRYEVVPHGVLPAQSRPVLTILTQPPYHADEGGSVVIEVAATDPDGDRVTVSASPSLSNATFEATPGVSASGVFSFTPSAGQRGRHSVRFTARDPGGLADSKIVEIHVGAVNRTPLLEAPEDREINEGEQLILKLEASDPDDDVLLYSAAPLPANAVFSEETGILAFAPDFEQAGVYELTFEASDGDLSDSKSARITVVDAPVSPPDDTNRLTLMIDPVASPTFATRQRITGSVNAPGGAPMREPATCAIITGLNPSVGRQGETLQVAITGKDADPYATTFGALSRADFGHGISVNSLQILGPHEAIAEIAVAPDAAPGRRDVFIATDRETAVSTVGFVVDPGTITLTGMLTDRDTSNAVVNALVTMQGTGYSTFTGADGSFSLSGLPPGEYTLIVNPPDHEMLQFAVNAQAGETFDLGSIATPATVFDPLAPASVSLLSVLGRGVGDFRVKDMAATKKAIVDALILAGGNEAGVLDEFGNQLNPEVVGPGLVSLTQDGVSRLAEYMDRGMSVSLAENLFAFSHAFKWTGDMMYLDEWIASLQAEVDKAWANPGNSENVLPILIFNQGRSLSPRPPKLSPETRLNPVQNYLFIASLFSYVIDPEGTNDFSLAQTSPARIPAPPRAPSGRKWTSYWRGLASTKTSFMQFQVNEAFQNYVAMGTIMFAAAGCCNVAVAAMPLTIAGLLELRIVMAFGSMMVGAAVPEPPRIVSTELVDVPRNGGVATRVRVKLRRSPSDKRDKRYFYTLYRFRNFNEGRQIAGFGFSDKPEEDFITVVDLAPLPGSSFYAATVTWLMDPEHVLTPNELNNATPWWNAAVAGVNDPFITFFRSKQKLISDYSDPKLLYVGSLASAVPVNSIEVHPYSDDVFYAMWSTNHEEQVILHIDQLGAGKAIEYASFGFAAPGYDGLALDKSGVPYSHNKASDAMFGGRLFNYAFPRPREFVGSVNYFSRDLMFANPCDAHALSFGPPANPDVADEDLYVADMIAGQLKRCPVKASWDPYRRVAQPYAALPLSGKPVDMEHDAAGNTYVLMADAMPRLPFRDKEKGPMHKPPGAPIKDDCPPESGNPFVDPIYLFSGEFYEDAEDIRIKGRGLDFVWTRKYRSKIGANTVQGNNWDYSYNIYITTNGENIVVHDGNTRSDEYIRQTNNVWTLREFFRELRMGSNGVYSLEFEDGGKWVFNAFDGSPAGGRIAQSIDRTGNTLHFFHDGFGRLERVRDTLDRDVRIFYNGDGFISSIVDFSGRTWSYQYYGESESGGNPGDLKAVIRPAILGTSTGNDFPAGRRMSYTYSTGFDDPRLNGNLLTITDYRGNDPPDASFGRPYLRNVYSSTTNDTSIEFDRIVRQVWGGPNDIIDLSYVPLNPTAANGGAVTKTILNDRNGHVKEYFYDERNQCTIERVYTGKAAAAQPTTETANRPVNRLRPEDPDYFETRYEWTDDALKRREHHPNGNITEYVYEADLDPSAPARTRGNIRAIRRLPGSHEPAGDQDVIEELYEYDTSFGRGCCGFNFVTRHVDGRGNETRKFYDSRGNLTSVIQRIDTIVEEYEYNSYGQMVRSVSPDNGSGHRRVDRMVYYTSADGHWNGYLKQMIADEGGLDLTTTYEYDQRGNIVRMIDPRGNDTLYEVNADDMIVCVKTPVAESGARNVTRTFYDANGNVIRTEALNLDENGNPRSPQWLYTATAYDILNMPLKRTEQVDASRIVVTEYEYDAERNRILTRMGEAVAGRQPGNVVKTEYDECGRLFRTVLAPGLPNQSTSQVDYDGNGNVIRTVSGLEDGTDAIVITYDGYNRKVCERDPMGNQTVINYDSGSMPVRIRSFGELEDAEGDAGNVLLSEILMGYDAMSRQTSSLVRLFDPATQEPLGEGQALTRTFFNDLSQVTRIVSANGHETRTVYDRAGRAAVIIDAATNTITRSFDAAGNVVLVTTEERADDGATSTYTTRQVYDRLNRVIRTIDSAGNTNSIFYDSFGHAVREVDARGNTVIFERDGLGRLVRTRHVMTADGTGGAPATGEISTSQEWDDSNRLVAQTDDNGNRTGYVYDELNRLIATRMPDTTESSIAHDARGNTVSSLDGNGTITKYFYDRLDRLLRKEYVPAPGVSGDLTFEEYQYDGLSRCIRADDDDSVVARRYDSAGRLMSETLNGRIVEYTHDNVGNVTACRYPGSRTITNRYDGLNRLRSISDSSGDIAAYSYLGPARVGTRTYANSTEMIYWYDDGRRVTRTRHGRTGATPAAIDDREYAWDAANNKTSRSDRLGLLTHQYSYDSINRLVRSSKSVSDIVDYVLDGAGNRTTAGGAYSMSWTLPEPGDGQVNQYTATPLDGRTYDRNGNLRAHNVAGVTHQSNTYDGRNQLVLISNRITGISARYAYDPYGRRIGKQLGGTESGHTLYFYDGQRVIEETTPAGTTEATYTYGRYIDERLTMRRGGQDYYYHGDDLHNVMKLTDAAGVVVEQYDYADYGQPTSVSAEGNPYLFGGREYDPESGYYHCRSRFLDPAAGRFVSRDIIGVWGDKLSLGNAFTYAANNPWTFVDPYGQSADFVAGFIGGIASSAGGVGLGIVGAPFGMAYAGYQGVTDPFGTAKGMWNGAASTLNSVFSRGDIGAGISYTFFPDLMRKGFCWEYISDYERGHAIGKASADVVITAVSIVQGYGQLRQFTMSALRVGRSAFIKIHGHVTHTRFGIYRSAAGYERYGMFTKKELAMIADVADEFGVTITTAGSGSETRIGMRNRYNPNFKDIAGGYDDLGFRAKKPHSGLIDEGIGDIDLWDDPGIPFDTKQNIKMRIEQKFPGWDVDFGYSANYYPDLDAFGARGGCLRISGDGATERIFGQWQLPTWGKN